MILESGVQVTVLNHVAFTCIHEMFSTLCEVCESTEMGREGGGQF